MINTIEIPQEFTKGSDVTEEFDVFLDRVLDQLYALDVEADYLANSADLTAEWTITVDADGSLDGIAKASTALRTALHAAHCGTRAWLPLEEIQKAVTVYSPRENLVS